MNSAIEITKNFCVFLTLCIVAGLCGAYFFVACLSSYRNLFFGPIPKRLHSIYSTTSRYIKWKANRLLGENVFSLAA